MDFIAELYGMILNLIKNILEVFGADTGVVDGLLEELKGAAEEEETPAV